MRRRELLSGSFCAVFSWRTFSLILVMVALAIWFSGRTSAQTPVTPRFNPANGHYYEVIGYPSGTAGQNVDRSFATALSAASAKSYNGLQGHLVTITSDAERTFLASQFSLSVNAPYDSVWIGASDAAVEGDWRWVTGPEAGQLFWRTEGIRYPTGGLSPIFGTALGFESWGRGDTDGSYYEPNDANDDEDFATLYFRQQSTLPPPAGAGAYWRNMWWNDLFGVDAPPSGRELRNWVTGYMVEYSVPEPGTGWLALMGLAGVSRAARPRRVTKRPELLTGSFCTHFRRRTFLLILAALAIGFSGRATAQSPVGPQLNPANGHYYETVRYPAGPSVDRTFATALAAASAKSHDGLPGHLVTITSSEEQVFLETTFWRALADRGWWMGASDEAVEGEWRWIAGPEAGQLFWKTDAVVQGSPVGTALGFESWLRDDTNGAHVEPNNQADGAGEDYATLRYIGGLLGSPPPAGAGPYYRTVMWNDLFGVDGLSQEQLSTWVSGYVVEYSVPEPGTGWLALLGLAGVSRAARRRTAAKL